MDKMKAFGIAGTVLTLAGSGLSILKGMEEERRKQEELDEMKNRLAELETAFENEGEFPEE